MSTSDWDIDCRSGLIRTDERGIYIIQQETQKEIEYPDLAAVESQSVEWWRVLAQRAYLWTTTFLVCFIFGGMMTALVEFNLWVVGGYALVSAGTFAAAARAIARTFVSYQDNEIGRRLLLETTEGETLTVSRRGGWPNGFEQFLLSRAGE